jgi:hypothetical protein
MTNNNERLISLIQEYHQKVREYECIQEDYKRLKQLQNKVETVTVMKEIPAEYAGGTNMERIWHQVVAEMGTRIAEMLMQGNGLHVEQNYLTRPFGNCLLMKTEFKFIKTMGQNNF